eukprot:TRINITY_DN43799_c0_g1_i1.p1 TRINITY_DN43799_c0_g1~~TRINITY_DN43799_c0_g1_i1.p1  ORF type:complete len:813 (+),score=140.01 TRINITY_DN43799_c0_g1_i1:199-2439(+)
MAERKELESRLAAECSSAATPRGDVGTVPLMSAPPKLPGACSGSSEGGGACGGGSISAASAQTALNKALSERAAVERALLGNDQFDGSKHRAPQGNFLQSASSSTFGDEPHSSIGKSAISDPLFSAPSQSSSAATSPIQPPISIPTPSAQDLVPTSSMLAVMPSSSLRSLPYPTTVDALARPISQDVLTQSSSAGRGSKPFDTGQSDVLSKTSRGEGFIQDQLRKFEAHLREQTATMRRAKAMEATEDVFGSANSVVDAVAKAEAVPKSVISPFAASTTPPRAPKIDVGAAMRRGVINPNTTAATSSCAAATAPRNDMADPQGVANSPHWANPAFMDPSARRSRAAAAAAASLETAVQSRHGRIGGGAGCSGGTRSERSGGGACTEPSVRGDGGCVASASTVIDVASDLSVSASDGGSGRRGVACFHDSGDGYHNVGVSDLTCISSLQRDDVGLPRGCDDVVLPRGDVFSDGGDCKDHRGGGDIWHGSTDAAVEDSSQHPPTNVGEVAEVGRGHQDDAFHGVHAVRSPLHGAISRGPGASVGRWRRGITVGDGGNVSRRDVAGGGSAGSHNGDSVVASKTAEAVLPSQSPSLPRGSLHTEHPPTEVPVHVSTLETAEDAVPVQSPSPPLGSLHAEGPSEKPPVIAPHSEGRSSDIERGEQRAEEGEQLLRELEVGTAFPEHCFRCDQRTVSLEAILLATRRVVKAALDDGGRNVVLSSIAAALKPVAPVKPQLATLAAHLRAAGVE